MLRLREKPFTFQLDMKPADLIWIDYHGNHPAVVIEVHGDKVLLVVCGTGTPRYHDPTMLVVQPRDPTGVAFGLSKPTYFYESKVAVVDASKVTREIAKRCPPNVFHALEELARSAAEKGLVPTIPAKHDALTSTERIS